MSQDIVRLQDFREDVKNGGYYGVWYVLNCGYFPLSQKAKNVVVSYIGDRCRIEEDDFTNIIQILEIMDD